MTEPGEIAHAGVKTILIVEDDQDIGGFISQAIQDETPYQPLLVHDGFQALKVVANLKPNLFLLDYQLPGMSGLKLYDQLHTLEDLEEVPAVMMSVNLPQAEMKKRSLLGLRKPFELDELLQIITDILA
jgi:DNA-binding response OmpR family regulator